VIASRKIKTMMVQILLDILSIVWYS